MTVRLDPVERVEVEQYIVPIGVVVTVLVLIMFGLSVLSLVFSRGLKYPKVEEYTLDQKWEIDPLLFSATEIEPMTLGRDFQPSDVDGSSASGKW